jgi:chemotaxis protein MotB
MRATIAIVIAGLALGACVKKSTYRQLQADKEAEAAALNAQLQERDQTIQTLEQALATEEARVAALETELAGVKAEYDRTRSELEGNVQKLEGDLAAVVKDKARLQESAEELRAALAEVSKRKAQAEARVGEFKDLLARFKALIDAGKLRVKIADGRMVLELPTDVLFDSGSADLSPAGQQAIAEVGQVLATLDDRKFQVEGHTDNVPIKTRKYPSNWELAADRALVVVKTLMASGVGGSLVSAASYGEHRPVAPNSSDAGRTANRRIEIVVVPDLSQLPGFDELNRAMEAQ